MIIDPALLGVPESYRLMTGVVVPRPIAWVTTLNDRGGVNLAPFSCFTFVSHDPILVGFSVGRRSSGRKDTAVNIERDRAFVVNIAHESEADLVHGSSQPFPSAVSEVERLGLATVPSSTVRPPRLASAPVALECELDEVVRFGRAPSEFIVGRVTLVHVKDGLFRDGKIDTSELRPLARIAGPNYSKIETVMRYSASFQQL